jgi:hypothetical protein
VGPTLDNWYSTGDAVAAFGTGERPEPFCGGQVVVLSSVVLCVVTVRQTIGAPHVSSPSRVVWRPELGVGRMETLYWR